MQGGRVRVELARDPRDRRGGGGGGRFGKFIFHKELKHERLKSTLLKNFHSIFPFGDLPIAKISKNVDFSL